MFVVLRDGSVLRAPPGDPRTHVEWLAALFGSDEAQAMIRNCVRGYVLNGHLRVYQGDDFSHHVNHAAVLAAIDDFAPLSSCKIDEVGFGAVYEKGVQPWPPRGSTTIRQFRHHLWNKRTKADGQD
jgi:hypothetical protein